VSNEFLAVTKLNEKTAFILKREDKHVLDGQSWKSLPLYSCLVPFTVFRRRL